MRRSIAQLSSKRVFSIGFSGAGFMGSYHVGVAACLIQYGILPSFSADDGNQGKIRFKLTGVSAGSLISSAVIAGVKMEDAMDVVMGVGRSVRQKCGIMDVLTPGFSLVDEVETLMKPILKQALNGGDCNLLQKRLMSNEGSRLRIGFTDVKMMKECISNGRVDELKEKGYRYMEEFQTVDNLIAASVISSYIPGATGPITTPSSGTIPRSIALVNAMYAQIKDVHGECAYSDISKQSDINLIDGGLVNMWPTFDETTVVVSPLSGNFSPNPFICPTSTLLEEANQPSSPWPWHINWKIKDPYSKYEVFITKANTETLRRMILSSTDEVLEARFKSGWDDAR